MSSQQNTTTTPASASTITEPPPDLERGPNPPQNNHNNDDFHRQQQQQREATGKWLIGPFMYRVFCLPTASITHQMILFFSFAIFLPIFMIFFLISAIVLLIRSALGYDPPPPSPLSDPNQQQINPSMVAVSALINEFAPASAPAHPPLPRPQRLNKDPDDCLTEKELENFFPVTTVGEFLADVKSSEESTKKNEKTTTRCITESEINTKLSSSTPESDENENDNTIVQCAAEPSHATPKSSTINPIQSTTSSSKTHLSHHFRFPKISSSPSQSSSSKTNAASKQISQQYYSSTSLMCPICQIQFGHEHDDDDNSEKPPIDTSVPLRVLHCGHAFHDECIRRWLCHVKPTCPLCNRVFATKRKPEPTEYFEGYFWI